MIDFSIQRLIRNKPAFFKKEYADNWETTCGNLDDLEKVVKKGYAFVPVKMKSSHRNSMAFESSSLVVVDIDSGQTIEDFKSHKLHPFACWAYTTPSHNPAEGKHRFRVIFKLPEIIHDADIYREIVKILINELGGDTSCTDPCRLYYGNSEAQELLSNRDAVLTDEIIEKGSKNLQIKEKTYDPRFNNGCDDHSIALAIYCLETVITPTGDGEREKFTKVTAAASSAGDDLYNSWYEWAKQCHHTTDDKQKRRSHQLEEKFFYGFRGTSLASLFFIANEDDPSWRTDLPDELKNNNEYQLNMHGNGFQCGGYEHSQFMGLDDDDCFDTQVEDSTEGLFSSNPTWTASASNDEPDDLEEDVDSLFDQDNGNSQDQESDDQPPRQGRGRAGENQVSRIRELLANSYPGLRLNEMNQTLEFGPHGYPVEIDDPTHMYLRLSEREGTTFQKTIVFDMAHVVGKANAYHPVKNYLELCAQKYDPIPYFETLATELLGVSDDETQNPRMPDGTKFADTILKRFLIGSVARVINPGCRHDWMPVLVGDQNCGKSTFFQYLTPPSLADPGIYNWVTTMQMSIEYLKDKPHALHSGWIVVMDEFERYTKRKYSEELKNLVSVGVDRSARKYENERSYKRAFVLAGATNSADFLCDPTGNRRFMPILVEGKVPSPQNPKIKIIDLDRLKQDRGRIWSAAYKAFQSGESNVLTSHELSYINEYADSFTRDNSMEATLEEKLTVNTSGYENGSGKAYYTLKDIFQWLDIPITNHRAMTPEIVDCLKRRGLKKKTIRRNNKQLRVWITQN